MILVNNPLYRLQQIKSVSVCTFLHNLLLLPLSLYQRPPLIFHAWFSIYGNSDLRQTMCHQCYLTTLLHHCLHYTCHVSHLQHTIWYHLSWHVKCRSKHPCTWPGSPWAQKLVGVCFEIHPLFELSPSPQSRDRDYSILMLNLAHYIGPADKLA